MKNVFLALCCGVALFACNKPKEAATQQEVTTQPAAPVTPPQAEIGDPKYVEIGKQGIQFVTSGKFNLEFQPLSS